MAEARAPQGTEWNDAVDVLHGLTNALMVRQLYREGHPAIAKADVAASDGFQRLFAHLPEIVLALLDGEFVVCERPMPDLRKRLSTLALAMERLGIDCLVLQRGVTADECTLLAQTLTHAGPVSPRQLRDTAQAGLPHVLLRHAQLRGLDEQERKGSEAAYFVPLVARALSEVRHAIAAERLIDHRPVFELAERMVRACEEGLFLLEPIAWAPGVDREPAHAANVATMTAAMALDAGLSERTCIDVTAAAIVHDIGRLFLPDEIRGVPEPLLSEEQRTIYRHHAFVGASALLGAGAPPLWVAAALEHHRGVDGQGWPALPSKSPPDRLVRLIALASFVDTRRTRFEGRGDDSLQALEAAFALDGRFFGAFELRSFSRALGPFPPGTTVELSDRRAAIVTRVNAADPERPVVRIVCGEGAGKRADLSSFDAVEERHHLSIVRPSPPPLVVRPQEAAPSVSATRIAAAASEPIAVTVIEAVEVDMPSSIRPSAPPLRFSGFYSSVDRAKGAPESTRDLPPELDGGGPESLRFGGPTSSVPPPVRGPLSRASVRMPVAEAPRPPSAPPASVPTDLPLDRIPELRVKPAELSKLPLDAQAGFVLSLIDGHTSIEGIVDVSGLPADHVLSIVQRLITMGVLGLR